MEPGQAPEDFRSSAYQLDTTTDELPPYKILADLSVLRSFRRESAQSPTLLTCNEMYICWAEDCKVRVLGTSSSLSLDEPGQKIAGLAIRRDSNFLAVSTTNKLVVKDLDREAQPVLLFSKQDPGFKQVVWHPTQQRVLGTAYDRELTTWEMSDQPEQSDPRRYKVLVQSAVIIDFSFSGEVPQVVTIALEGGQIRTIDTDSESILFETRPHAMSSLYNSSLFVSHFPLGSLLTLGKSNNELSLWNWEKKEKMHTLNIKSNDTKVGAFLQGRIFLADVKNRTLTILTTCEQSGKLRFSSIIDYSLDISVVSTLGVRVTSLGDVEVICLGKDTLETFPIPDLKATPELLLLEEERKAEDDPRKRKQNRSEKRKKQSQSQQSAVPVEQLTALQRRIEELQARLEGGTLVTSVQERVEKVIADNMEKLSGIIREEQQKIQVSMKILLAQSFKEQFQATILPNFEGAIKEMFTQVTIAFQEGVKEFTERNALEDAKFQSVLQHMKASVETTSELTTKLGKTAFKQLKRVNDLEIRLNERLASIPQPREEPQPVVVEHQVPALKLELDRLLRNEEFEAAIGLVMAERDERLVYTVLRVINPGPLYQGKPLTNGLSLRLCHRLLTHFPTRDELPECLLWLQEICKNVTLKGEDPTLVQNILEMMVSRSKTSPEISGAKETFFSKIMQDMQDRHSVETLKALQRENKAVKEMTTEERLNEIKEQLAVQMQGKKRVASKSPAHLSNDIRYQLQQNLNKLNVLATRDAGVREIRRLIEENVTADALNILLGNLKEQKKTRTSKAREQEVLLIAHIAFVYRLKLVDEGSTPLKTLTRITALIHQYFKDLNREVHEAAGTALCELYVHSFPKSTPEAAVTFLFDPLVTIMTTGSDVQMQHAAGYSIYKWSLTLAKRTENDVLTAIFPKVVGLFLKMRPEYPDLISALGVLMDSCGFERLIPDLVNTLAKLVQYVQSKQANSQILKLESCKFLKVLPGYLKSYPDLDFESMCQDILPALFEAKSDKQPEVQISASRAHQEWKSLVSIQEQVRKSQEKPAEDAGQPSGFRPLTTARAISKVKKEWEANSDLNFKAKWGVSKPQILEKGSGKYGQIKLGTGKIDLVKALANRPSIRNMVATRLQTPKVGESMLSGLLIPRSAPSEPLRQIETDFEQSEEKPTEVPLLRSIQKQESDESLHIEEPVIEESKQQFHVPELVPAERPTEAGAFPQRPAKAKAPPTLKFASGSAIDIRPPQKASTPVSTQVTQTSISRFATTGTQYEEEFAPQEEVDEEEIVRDAINVIESEVERVFADMNRSFVAVTKRCDEIDTRIERDFTVVARIREAKAARRRREKKKAERKDSSTQTICEVSVQTSIDRLPIPKTTSRVRLHGTDKSVQASPRPAVDEVTAMWTNCLRLLAKGDTSESYRSVLSSGDDLYLLRLMLKTGVCIDELDIETAETLLERLSLITTSGFLDLLGEQWVKQGEAFQYSEVLRK